MDEAERRIMEMKIEEAIAWHDRKVIQVVATFGGKIAPGDIGDQELDIANRELYRMIRTATGIDA